MINRSRAICFASCPMMRMVYIFLGKELDDVFAKESWSLMRSYISTKGVIMDLIKTIFKTVVWGAIAIIATFVIAIVLIVCGLF